MPLVLFPIWKKPLPLLFRSFIIFVHNVHNVSCYNNHKTKRWSARWSAWYAILAVIFRFWPLTIFVSNDYRCCIRFTHSLTKYIQVALSYSARLYSSRLSCAYLDLLNCWPFDLKFVPSGPGTRAIFPFQAFVLKFGTDRQTDIQPDVQAECNVDMLPHSKLALFIISLAACRRK